MLRRFYIQPSVALAALAVVFGLIGAVSVRADDLHAVQGRIMADIEAKNYTSAISEAETFEPQHPHHLARVEFIKGLVAKAMGKMPQAIKHFRASLSEDPSLYVVRQELAAALYASGDYEAAKYNFDVLQANTTNPRLLQIYANAKAAMEKNKPWSINGYFSLAPSSNINKGSNNSSATLFDIPGWQIDPTQQKQAGFGLVSGLSGSYNFQVSNNFFLTANGGLDGQFYLDHSRNSMRISESLKPGFVSDDKKFRVAIGPYVAESLNNYNHSLTQYGLDGDLSIALDPSLSATISGTALYQNFVWDVDRDGFKLDGNFRLTKLLADNWAVGVIAGSTFEGAQPQRQDLQHTDWRLGLNASKEWGGGWMTSVEASVANHRYNGLLTGKDFSRMDWAASAGVQISNRNLSAYGFMPVLSYSYTKQWSNDEWSDYDSHDVSVGLTREF